MSRTLQVTPLISKWYQLSVLSRGLLALSEGTCARANFPEGRESLIAGVESRVPVFRLAVSPISLAGKEPKGSAGNTKGALERKHWLRSVKKLLFLKTFIMHSGGSAHNGDVAQW